MIYVLTTNQVSEEEDIPSPEEVQVKPKKTRTAVSRYVTIELTAVSLTSILVVQEGGNLPLQRKEH